jgi:hypothetical protein
VSVLKVRAMDYDSIRGYIHARDLFIEPAPASFDRNVVTLRCGEWSGAVDLEELKRTVDAAWELWGKKLP